MKYRPRWLAENMRQALDVNPVIILSGARQTGKSTLLRKEKPFRDWRYVSLDDIDVLGLAQDDPKSLLSVRSDTIIDEIQRAPAVLPVIKSLVDENRERRYVLSGSANLLLMKQVTETLAGRSTFFHLLPFSYREWRFKDKAQWFVRIFNGDLPPEGKYEEENLIPHLFRGFLPPVLILEKHEQISLWWEGYTKTYLERDLRELSEISSLSDFKKVMEVLALQSGCILNETDIARRCSMSQPTVHRYINLLETSHLFLKLRPFTRGKIRRIIKSPKGYFLDPGLVCYLAGHNAPESITPVFSGYLFESLILLNLSIMASVMRAHLFYWRTWGGKEKEVDFIYELGQKAIAIEVKFARKISLTDILNLKYFLDNYKKALAGLVIYNGDEMVYLTENIIAVPWTALC